MNKQKFDREFLHIYEKAVDSCRRIYSDCWVLEPDPNDMQYFKGILFGKKDSYFAGCAFSFTLVLDPDALSQPPKITFDQPLEHPFILPSGGISRRAKSDSVFTQVNYFCFPEELSITCRDPIETILKTLYDIIFLTNATSLFRYQLYNPNQNTKDLFLKNLKNLSGLKGNYQKYGDLKSNHNNHEDMDEDETK